MATIKKSQVGVSLDEILDSLAKNQETISDDLKKVLDEDKNLKAQARAQKRAQNKAEAANTVNQSTEDEKNKQKEEQEKKKKANTPSAGREFARGFLTNLLGKDIAAKLLRKKEPLKSNDGEKKDDGEVKDKTEPKKPRTSSYAEDIRLMKADVQEIKDFLMAQKKPLGANVKVRRGIWKKFAIGAKNALLRRNDPIPPPTPVAARNVEPDEPKIARVPLDLAPHAIDDYAGKVQAEMQRMAPGSVPKQIDSESGSAAQADVTKVKLEAKHAEEVKATHDKLDKILSELREMKKQLGANSGGGGKWGGLGVLALILGAVKKFWGNLVKLGKRIMQFGKDLGKKIGNFFSDMWARIKKHIPKPIRKLLGISEEEAASVTTKDAGREIERIAGKDAMKLGGKLAGKDLLKAIPIVGAFAGAGFAAYDLMKGDKADAGFDLTSGLLGGTGIGDIAGGVVDAAQAAYDLKHAKPVGKPAVAPIPPQLPAKLTAATMTKQELASTKSSEPQVIMVQGDNKTTVVQAPATNAPDILIQPRNPDPSVDSVNAGLFDAPQGYGALYRM